VFNFRLSSLNCGFGVAFASLLIVAASSCTGDGPGGPEIPYEEFAGALEDAECEWRVACNLSESQEICREARFLDRADPYVSSAIEAGTVVFHGDAAYRCIDEIRGRSCERTEPPAPSCEEVFTGGVAPEGLCLVSEECIGDGLCGFDPNCTEQCCAGACRLLPGPVEIGESCLNSRSSCVDGAFCELDPMTFMRTVCAARLPVGSSCFFDGECVQAAGCNLLTNVCESRVGEGELCQAGQIKCQEDLYCDWVDDNYEEQRCRSSVHLVGLGEPCDMVLGSLACKDVGTLCSEAGICVLAPAPGETCVDHRCASYASCADQNTCVADVGTGERCGYFDENYDRYVSCAEELICSGDFGPDSVCTAPLFSGESCEVPGTPIESSSPAS